MHVDTHPWVARQSRIELSRAVGAASVDDNELNIAGIVNLQYLFDS
jgi:hypothetical protein